MLLSWLFHITNHYFLDAIVHKSVPKKRFLGIKEVISRDFKTRKIVSSPSPNDTFSIQHQTGKEEKTANPLGEYRIEVAHDDSGGSTSELPWRDKEKNLKKRTAIKRYYSAEQAVFWTKIDINHLFCIIKLQIFVHLCENLHSFLYLCNQMMTILSKKSLFL